MVKLTKEQKKEFDKIAEGVKYYQNNIDVTAIVINGGKLLHKEFEIVKVEGNENGKFSKS